MQTDVIELLAYAQKSWHKQAEVSLYIRTEVIGKRAMVFCIISLL